jgi:signal transduction histidine kinase
MPATASTRRSRWAEAALGFLAVASLVATAAWPMERMIPFHLVWVSLALASGFRPWKVRTTVLLLALTSVLSGAAMAVAPELGESRWHELPEVPLMATLFAVMAWHARRRQVALEEVSRLASAQQDFVRNASHELRTPITIARGYAELVRAESTGAQQRDVAVVVEELERLTRISDRMLLLAASAHADGLHRTRVDAAELLRTAIRRWSVVADRHWVVTGVDEAMLDADRAKLEAALDALLENAVAFTGPGETIAVSAHVGADLVRVEVADTGRGIPAEALPHIFERFARADSSRARGTGGTGLGLAIVAAIVAAHGGRVQIDSVEGAGTTVALVLPPAVIEPRAVLTASGGASA